MHYVTTQRLQIAVISHFASWPCERRPIWSHVDSDGEPFDVFVSVAFLASTRGIQGELSATFFRSRRLV